MIAATKIILENGFKCPVTHRIIPKSNDRTKNLEYWCQGIPLVTALQSMIFPFFLELANTGLTPQLIWFPKIRAF